MFAAEFDPTAAESYRLIPSRRAAKAVLPLAGILYRRWRAPEAKTVAADAAIQDIARWHANLARERASISFE